MLGRWRNRNIISPLRTFSWALVGNGMILASLQEHLLLHEQGTGSVHPSARMKSCADAHTLAFCATLGEILSMPMGILL